MAVGFFSMWDGSGVPVGVIGHVQGTTCPDRRSTHAVPGSFSRAGESATVRMSALVVNPQASSITAGLTDVLSSSVQSGETRAARSVAVDARLSVVQGATVYSQEPSGTSEERLEREESAESREGRVDEASDATGKPASEADENLNRVDECQ